MGDFFLYILTSMWWTGRLNWSHAALCLYPTQISEKLKKNFANLCFILKKSFPSFPLPPPFPWTLSTQSCPSLFTRNSFLHPSWLHLIRFSLSTANTMHTHEPHLLNSKLKNVIKIKINGAVFLYVRRYCASTEE